MTDNNCGSGNLGQYTSLDSNYSIKYKNWNSFLHYPLFAESIKKDISIEDRMQSLKLDLSCSSPIPSPQDLSPSLFDSDEFEFNNLNLSGFTNDELPAFQIRTISPSGLSLSPIEDTDYFHSDELESPRFNMAVSPEFDDDEDSTVNHSHIFEFDDFVTLDQIDEQISTPPKSGRYSNSNKNLNLETIFEDVFLETPTKVSNRFIQFLKDT